MGLWDRVAAMIALAPMDHPPIELSHPTVEQQLARIQRQSAARPWRPASVQEALGVPAIFGAVSLIANVSATLTLRGLRDGVEMPAEERPRVIIRPNPHSTMRDFVRETVWSMAAYGEAWLWIAATDSHGDAISVVTVDPREVTVEANGGDWLRPRITWRNKVWPAGSMVQVVHSREPGGLRGFGPLQACGAAVSVSVEAQEWAANYFAEGGNPSIHIHSDDDLDPKEAAELREQWVSTPPNTPQVTSGTMKVEEIGKDTPGAQMLEARTWQVGDVARMFHVPGSMLEFAREGSSLTYQNVSSEFDKLMKSCLLPDYLEPIEQAMSDLLPRSITARFNQDALLRADIKTRYDVYKVGVETVDPKTGESLMTVAEARTKEGLAGGDIENAPVPKAPPAAVPVVIPMSKMRDINCPSCSRLLVRSDGRVEGRCRHCKVDVAA